MIAERGSWVLAVLVAAAGCGSTAGDGIPADGAQTIAYERFTSTTWSLASMNGQAQLSISDVAGAPACALASDQHNHLAGAGVQIIMQLPDMPTGTCPVANYEIAGCPNNLGNAAYVPVGCAFYRKFDAAGNVIGTAAALNGVIKIGGSATSCAIQATVGFLGASFTEQFSLSSGDGMQPWCRSS